MWTPDVYEGAPDPVTAFVATVSKGAVVALLLRYLIQTGASAYRPVRLVLSLIAIASMLVGNGLALLQDNVKRLLAYASIAQLGYLLVALVAGGPRAAKEELPHEHYHAPQTRRRREAPVRYRSGHDAHS